MGTWDVTDTTTTETEQESGHSKHKTRYGVVETTVTRNTSNSGVEVENIGDEVRVEMTPGGLYNRTVTTAAREDVGTIARACEKDVFHETDSTTENKKDDPGEQHVEAGDGKHGSKSARMTDMGTWDVTDTTTTETEQGWTYDQRKTLRGTRTTTIKRNTADNSTDTPNVGDEVHLEMTPGGRYNRTETKLSVQTGLGIRDAYADTHHDHSETHTRVGNASTAARDKLEVGERTSSDSRQNEDGTWDNTDMRAEGEAQELSLTFQSDERKASYKWWLNQQPGYSQEVASGLDKKHRNNVSGQVNDFGLENGSATSYQVKDSDGDGDFVSWGWNMMAGREYYEYRQHRVNTGGTPEIKSQRAKFKRYHGEGLWRKYMNAINALKRMLESGSGGGHSLPAGYGVDRYSFGLHTLVSGRRCYRIQVVSNGVQVGNWEDVVVN